MSYVVAGEPIILNILLKKQLTRKWCVCQICEYSKSKKIFNKTHYIATWFSHSSDSNWASRSMFTLRYNSIDKVYTFDFYLSEFNKWENVQ